MMSRERNTHPLVHWPICTSSLPLWHIRDHPTVILTNASEDCEVGKGEDKKKKNKRAILSHRCIIALSELSNFYWATQT